MKRSFRSRVSAFLMALVMVFSLIPATVFAGSSATWTKVDLADITENDTVMITMTNPSGVTYALDATATQKNPAVIVTVDGTTITADSDAYGWTIKATEGGYHIMRGGNYLYTINDNNGMRVGTTVGVWTLDGNYLKSTDGTNDRWLGVYDNNNGAAVASPNWRAYKNTTGNTKNQTVGFWKLEGSDGGEDPKPETPTGTEYAKTATIADGDVVVIYNAASGTMMSSAMSSYKLSAVAATPADGKITTADENVAWTVSVEGGKYTFSQGDKVLGAVQSGTYVNPSLKASDGYTTWTLEAGAADATWYVKNDTFPAGNYGPYYLEYYSGYTLYASNSPSDAAYGFVFYKLGGTPSGGEDPQPDPKPDPKPEVSYATKMTALPDDGDTIIVYNSGNAMGAAASGSKISAVAATVSESKLPIAEEMAQLLVTIDEDGNYIFSLDGKYLTSGPTGNALSFASELSDCGKWTAEAATDGTWYLKNVGANYNGSYNQALEYYNGFTTYGIKETAIYQMELFLVSKGEPQAPEVTHATKMTALPGNGDTIIIYNSGNAMGAAASGSKISAVAATVSESKLPIAEEMAQLLVTIDEDGNYIFSLDGKYLTSGPTGNALSFASELSDCGKWTAEAATDGTWYLKNVGANYNGSYNQALEYYNGFTTYGIKETAIYQMELFLVSAGKAEAAGKLTSADQFVTGTYAMVVDGGYAMGALDGTWVSMVQPTISGGAVTDAKGGVWTLTVNGSSVQITDSNGASIKPKGGNNNGISSGSYDWSWSFDEATQTFTFKGTGSDTVTLASNANEDPTYGGFHKFRGYKNTTVSGSPDTYPCSFTLYPIAKQESESTLPAEGDQVVLYNLSAKGVLAAENDTQSIENALAEIVDGKAVPANGGVVFTVSKNGEYYRFYNETYGYLCSNGTGNNAFYSKEATDDADWTLSAGKKDGYNLESRTAKFNGMYSQFLEYYADSYKTYSMNKVTDYDIYEFCFYAVADDVALTGGIVNQPCIDFGTLTDAYVGADYTFSFTVDAVFGVDGALEVQVNGETVTANDDGSYTVKAEKVTGTELAITVTGKDTKGVAISGNATVAVKDEPFIGTVTPAAGSQTLDNKRPVISAQIINAKDGATITMTVNEQAVEAVFADGMLTYTPAADMADGRTTVTVKVVRADSKETSKTWSFTVGEAQYELYFGQLHSHTTYSDGSGSLQSALDYIGGLPESANVDFVAFTDHSNYFDTTSAANPEQALYDMSLASASSQEMWNEYKSAVAKFNASQGNVVALGGFEMTWSGGPGHINTFNTPGIVSRNNSTLNNKTSDAGMKAYYALLSQTEGADSISQFNHPGSTFGTFTDFAYWDAVIDERIQLVEVGNGEGQVGAGGYYPSYEYYTMALDKGWHVAPTNNQDNHKGKWGNANDARDVVLTDDFSEEGIYQAIRDMRMYSTEDKNLEIGYSVNGMLLGSSITEVPEKLNIDVTVYDPDSSDSISKVEVIVNSGKVAYTWDDPADLADGALSVTLDPTYSYYYIRVTEGDGDLAVTAPVWVGESLKLGISSLVCGTSTPVTGEELELTTTLFNSEKSNATIESLTYAIKGGKVLGTDTTGYALAAGSTLPVTFKYTPDTARVMTITVTAVVDLDGQDYTFTMDVVLDVEDADSLVYIGIDASHYNEYVAGNYKDSMGNFGALAAEYSVRTVDLKTSDELIAACANEKYKAIILTAPSRRLADAQSDPRTYSAAELDALDAFNKAGGMLILAGWSDNYENYDVIQSNSAIKHMAQTQNEILAKVGSSLRIGDDATYDDVRSAADGVEQWRLYFNTYGEGFLTAGVEVDEDHPYDRLYTEVFSHYGGATVYTVDGTLPATVSPVVFGHSTTYSVDVDKDGLGGSDIPKYAYAEGDERLMAMASEQLPGRGLIIVSGAAFMSNFEVQATIEDSGAEKNYANYKICENLLKNINPATITDIADVQAQTEAGYKYTIEGIVTSNASGYDKDTAFFDCIYVQDATGGVCCFPVAGNFKIGDKVRVTGTTEFYQGEMELQVSSIEKIGEGFTVEPKNVFAKEVNDGTVLGQLITVKGHVDSFELANGLVQTIMVRDEKGELVRVFIDGYITTGSEVKNLKVGATVTVTGIASYDNTFNAPEGPFPRIRIRDRADIVCGAVDPDYKAPSTGDTFQPLLWLSLMALVTAAGAVVIARRKEQQ